MGTRQDGDDTQEHVGESMSRYMSDEEVRAYKQGYANGFNDGLDAFAHQVDGIIHESFGDSDAISEIKKMLDDHWGDE